MKLMILDGNSVVNRAFYGVRPLTTREGLYTNAIFGFLNILQRMEQEERPDGVCVAFDLQGPTFRHLRYDGYKATRHGMPQELAQQMPLLKEVLRAMNIPILECQAGRQTTSSAPWASGAARRTGTAWWSPGTGTACSSSTPMCR